MKSKNTKIVVVLPDIRSSYNIGSIFRTCDAVGVYGVVLAGYSPCPLDKFNRPQKEIAKTALGAEKDVPWKYESSPAVALRNLKNEDYLIIAVEQTEKSIDYKKFFKNILKNSSKKDELKLAIVFGTEVTGIPNKILKLCDVVIDIPMKGNKESLNVSVSAGIILYELV